MRGRVRGAAWIRCTANVPGRLVLSTQAGCVQDNVWGSVSSTLTAARQSFPSGGSAALSHPSPSLFCGSLHFRCRDASLLLENAAD